MRLCEGGQQGDRTGSLTVVAVGVQHHTPGRAAHAARMCVMHACASCTRLLRLCPEP